MAVPWRLRSPRTAKDLELIAGRSQIIDLNIDNWNAFRLMMLDDEVLICTVDEVVYFGVICEPNLFDPSNLIVVRILERLH